MFRRKLIALDFHNAGGFDANDESQFRNLIVWLEDQKIRHYKIEDRVGLRNIVGGDWEKFLLKFLEDLGCHMPSKERNSVVDWLLGYAVRLEYGDNVDKYKTASTNVKPKEVAGKSTNPLDTMDFSSPDFKAGVASLAQMLQIPPHHDHEIVIKAVCNLVKERLSKEAIEKAQKKNGKVEHNVPLDKMELGFDCGDYISNEAAKILRLLHVRELRELQNQVNEAIVAVQSLTANPKTDARLGKVGKF